MLMFLSYLILIKCQGVNGKYRRYFRVGFRKSPQLRQNRKKENCNFYRRRVKWKKQKNGTETEKRKKDPQKDHKGGKQDDGL